MIESAKFKISQILIQLFISLVFYYLNEFKHWNQTDI